MRIIGLFLACSLAVVAARSAADTSAERELVEQFYAGINALSDENASVDAVDRIFDLVSDDFVYDHPRYGGVYSREDLHAGFVRNLERGAYADDEPTTIADTIVGLDMVVVKRGDGKVTLFEFADGKIVRIKEYW